MVGLNRCIESESEQDGWSGQILQARHDRAQRGKESYDTPEELQQVEEGKPQPQPQEEEPQPLELEKPQPQPRSRSR